ncbi:Diguanylate cyclase [Candidatus Sulfopaludibacter sp. SbA4]|nr:Diguanylate cyclase [Candidatus Sulfopaludibacter sp. SbA4]
MISIRNSVSELERCHQEREAAVSCYLTAIRNIAHYTIKLDDQISEPHRAHLGALADDVAAGKPGVLEESNATLRSLLRDYRDKAAQYLNTLREELAGTARALEEILDSLSQSDGDHETRLRTSLCVLRQISASPAGGAVRAAVEAAADTIEQSVEQIRKQHQLTISQFQIEIRMLHKRIDSLEASASLDLLTQLLNRREIEERIRSAPPDSCLLLLRVNGFRLAEVHFRADVAAELAAAFTKRLRNCVPPTAAIGRWSHEEFAVILSVPRSEANSTAKWVAEHLSGSYACLLAGKTVRPTLQINVAVVESKGNTPDRLIERVKAFLTGN